MRYARPYAPKGSGRAIRREGQLRTAGVLPESTVAGCPLAGHLPCVADLLASLAVDAVDADERADVEPVVVACERCTAEHGLLSRVTAQLAAAVDPGDATGPSTEVWFRIALDA